MWMASCYQNSLHSKLLPLIWSLQPSAYRETGQRQYFGYYKGSYQIYSKESLDWKYLISNCPVTFTWLRNVFTETKRHKRTKDSRDEIHGKRNRLHFIIPQKHEDILQLKVAPVENKLAQHKQKDLKNVCRMEDIRCPKQIVEYRPGWPVKETTGRIQQSGWNRSFIGLTSWQKRITTRVKHLPVEWNTWSTNSRKQPYLLTYCMVQDII